MPNCACGPSVHDVFPYCGPAVCVSGSISPSRSVFSMTSRSVVQSPSPAPFLEPNSGPGVILGSTMPGQV